MDTGELGLKDWFDLGIPFPEYIAGTEKNHALWHDVYDRVRLPEEMPALADDRAIRLLVIAEDWCGDAVNTVPVVARAAERLGIDLRVVARDEHPALMDRYLTDGRSRSIPVVIGIDPDGNEIGWWGPRPADLQTWVLGEGQALPNDERYKEQRRWYVKDRGRTTLSELFATLGLRGGAGSEAAREII